MQDSFNMQRMNVHIQIFLESRDNRRELAAPIRVMEMRWYTHKASSAASAWERLNAAHGNVMSSKFLHILSHMDFTPRSLVRICRTRGYCRKWFM